MPGQAPQLRLTLEAPARAKSGRPVPLLFRVSNPGGAEISLALMGREPTADFRIADARDRPVWTRLKGQVMLGSLRLYPLAGKQVLTFKHAWDQRSDTGSRVPPGDYLVRGVLLTDTPGGLVSAAARLRIEP